jgi:hypothetical protein
LGYLAPSSFSLSVCCLHNLLISLVCARRLYGTCLNQALPTLYQASNLCPVSHYLAQAHVHATHSLDFGCVDCCGSWVAVERWTEASCRRGYTPTISVQPRMCSCAVSHPATDHYVHYRPCMNLEKGIDLPHHYVKGSDINAFRQSGVAMTTRNLQNKALLRALR